MKIILAVVCRTALGGNPEGRETGLGPICCPPSLPQQVSLGKRHACSTIIVCFTTHNSIDAVK